MPVDFVSCTPSDARCCLEPVRLHNLQQTTLLLTLLMHHATWIDLDSLFNCVVHNYVDSVACIFCIFCGQRLLYAQSHSDDGHAVTDPEPSDEELNDSHLPQLSVPSTSPSMTEQVAVRHSVKQRQPSP